MFTLPPLIEEDIQLFQSALSELLARTEASVAIVIDKGGFVVTQYGDSAAFDVTTLGALAAASFTANQAIANLIGEPNFNSVYQQGEKFSLLINNIDIHCLLVILFRVHVSVGAVKYYATETVGKVVTQLNAAQVRAPGQGFDLSMLNMADTADLFRKKTD
jgi:predicted regulator of Ras-like GTPase activity (Roadblock/LC7/MglB family)